MSQSADLMAGYIPSLDGLPAH